MEGITDKEIPIYSMNEIGLRAYSSDEIKALSVKEISYPISFNFLAHPNINGLYDPSLGPHDRDEICSTCGQNNVHCPGHMGHIQLELPVYNHVFFSSFFQLLKCTCFSCHRFVATLVDSFVFVSQLEILEAGYVTEYHSLADHVYSTLNKQDLNNMTILLEAKNITKEFIKNIMENSTKEKQTGISYIELCKRSLINQFVSQTINVKRCPHCTRKKKSLRQEHHCKITITSRERAVSNKSKKEKHDGEVLSHSGDEHNLDDIEMVKEEDEEDKENKGKTEVDANDSISLFFDKGADKKQTLLTPSSVREHLRALWKVDGHVLKKIFNALDSFEDSYCATDIFFLDVIPVPPCKFRPIAFRSGGFSEHPQSVALGRVIMDNIILKHILKYSAEKFTNGDIFDKIDEFAKKAVNSLRGTTVTEKLHYCWQRLQVHVNCLVDADMDKYKLDIKIPGIKQLLEKKTGLFRMHMMGKRVNYACRSVISPDPCLNINEVGIPLVFATRLSFPQPVTPWNVHELRQAVINGPLIHPGALFIENEDGFLTKLNPKDKLQREALAKQLLTPSSTTKSLIGCKKVYRHLKNGDVMLLNRQPTLHKPSIQAHKARVLSGEKTLRMHYANCKAYNADFDGDEMNAHFPQNEMARSEAYSLASTDFQYLAPKDGAPLAGLIQDHMVSGVALTIRGGFFTRGDYFNLVFSAISDKYGPIKILRPSIVKPCKLWSGKQVFSTVLLNLIPEGKIPLSLDGSAKINEKNWDKGKNRCEEKLASMGESKVIIRHGELLQGVLDKGHYGNTPYGLIHCCYELYGGNVAGALLSSLGRLFTAFLKLRGFTLGVADILVTEKANKKRAKIIRKYPKIGEEAVKKALGLAETSSKMDMLSGWKNAHLSTNDQGLREIDMCMKRKTDVVQNNISSVCMPGGLEKKFPDNNLQLMVLSGAKGSMVNCMQISCLLGQIELEGRRPPQMVNGSTLPSFLPYDASPKAGGFISGRFLTGIRPQEYFFHCMAGREGLVDTAVKTSRSGYLQRCLIKHLEGVVVNYDFTVRDSDSSIIQFYYGEDGLEVQKLPFLEPKQFPFLVQNRESISQMTMESESAKRKHFKSLQKKLKKWKKSNDPDVKKRFSSGFLKFCEEEGEKIVKVKDRRQINENGRLKSAEKLSKAWYNLDEEERKRYEKNCGACPDPVLSQIWPHEECNVKSEKLDYIVNKYYKEQFSSMVEELGIADVYHKEDFESLISSKVHHAYAEPGEAVGLLCAQSIGEPSTQMTLNTFHFAGRGEMNMTLGIPRLREILMTASEHIQTPAMSIPVHNTPLAREKAKILQRMMTRVTLAEVLQSVTTKESISCSKSAKVFQMRTYTIKYMLLPHDCYKNKLSMNPAELLHYIEHNYIFNLVESLKKHMGLPRSKRLVESGNVKKFNLGRKLAEDGDGNDDEDEDNNSIDEGGDADATATKQRERLKDTQEYVGEEDEEELNVSDDDEGEDEVDNKAPDEAKEEDTAEDTDRQKLIASQCPEVVKYKYDTKENMWCEVTLQFAMSKARLEISSLVQNHAKKSIIQSVSGINRVFVNEQTDKGQSVLQFMTDGINFQKMYEYGEVLDLNKLYCNNFKLFSYTYGIEAAARIIQQELKNVFGAYGIQVDHHHLSLLSDFMTFEGSIHPFNRIGIRNNASPFLKMTYETAMRFLVDSSIHANVDYLKSPSSRLVAGQVVSCGTKSFDILQPIR